MRHKRVLIFLVFFLFSPCHFSPVQAASIPHDGKIRFYVYHEDQFAEITYLDENGKWIESAYQKINYLLRSHGDNKVGVMDKRLIELADHLQDHFGVDTVEVICGYRSPSYNQQLRGRGANVARDSYHLKGLAMDIHIDEIKEVTLRDYLLFLNLGGVGYYKKNKMIHMDFGPVRKWEPKRPSQEMPTGIFNKKTLVRLQTDRFEYRFHALVKLSVDPADLVFKQPGIVFKLQKFFRGRWKDIVSPVITVQEFGPIDQYRMATAVLEPLSYGKFRLVYQSGREWQNSNEFYVKKE